MKILRNLKVPTGNICVMQGEKGLLEFLSIGDYGKDLNIKADFLGITKEISNVPNGEIMPLSEKWVITISTQYGCSMGCKFCDVPKVGRGINATYNDMVDQIKLDIFLHPEIIHTKRLNIHFARMGEPTYNKEVLEIGSNLKEIIASMGLTCDTIHPVVSTAMPAMHHKVFRFIYKWAELKNNVFNGEAGLQFSINSTDEDQRIDMFSGKALPLSNIAYLGERLPIPLGRKYTLNFALADGYKINATKLRELFDPKYFMCKITPIHLTDSCEKNGISTSNGYSNYTPYRDVEEQLKSVGFDVIVFIPSLDEDLGMITCGNAILSGKVPNVKFTEI